MSHNCCSAPRSETNIFNYSLAATQFAIENFTLGAPLTVTLANIPAAGFFLLFLNSVFQREGIAYTVDYINGVATLIGAVAGSTVTVVYIRA